MYDLERFMPRPFIQRLLGMGDMTRFLDKLQTVSVDKNKEMVKHLEQGIFTLRDMRDQLSTLMKMGPISKLGMGSFAQTGMSDEEDHNRLRRMIYMLDSMSEKGNRPRQV